MTRRRSCKEQIFVINLTRSARRKRMCLETALSYITKWPFMDKHKNMIMDPVRASIMYFIYKYIKTSLIAEHF